MLHLVQSNKMEVLCDQLIQRIQQYYQSSQDNSTHILTPLPILVQSPGMAQWLKVGIADSLGIAANFAFPLPSSFIWDLYRQNISNLPKESAFTKENMQWKLMHLLPEFLEHPDFSAIKTYLTATGSVSENRKLFQLAGQIADIYDQYLVYRPEWLLAWEKGNKAKEVDVKSHPWQPVLWQALVKRTEHLGESPWHRANLHQQLLSTLQKRNEPDLPVFVFGISAIPRQQLEIFSVLAQSREVVIFWANPCEHYWGDIVATEVKEKKQLDMFEQAAVTMVEENALLSLDLYETGNPLLASWGKLGREFQEMLLDCEASYGLGQEDYFVSQPRDTLLSHIQADVLELTSPQESGIAANLTESDDSIRVVSCHSKLRELEVLHDQLLRQLDKHRDLDLGDIIVMMPNVAEYAPFIDAVFGGAVANEKEKSRYLAYAISDRNLIEESPIVKAFMQLLNIHQSRFTLTEVLEIFAVPDVLTHFKVAESELEILQHWLRQSGVRWGIDGSDKLRWDLPEETQNTWLFGLRRLLSGYAMGQGEATLTTPRGEEFAPYVELEGQQVEVLGKFIEFLLVLELMLQQATQSASLVDKAKMAENWLILLFDASEEQHYYRQQILDGLARLSEHAMQYPDEVDQDVFAEAVKQQLGSKGVGQRFLAGKINFCTLMPMRSIPFKQVCLLGMNDPGYPRIVAPVGFDLMALAPARKGDRSRRWDDRYLFLEAILSARYQLYISFIGRDERDNSPRTPSILLTELLNYCETYHQEQERETKVVTICEHPLQPFHEGYYLSQGDSQQSYNQYWLKVLQARNRDNNTAFQFASEPLEPVDSTWRSEISIKELIACLCNSARYFFEHRWHTYFGHAHSNAEDNEPLVLDGLSRYQLVQELLLQDQQAHKRFVLDGRLPIGNLANEAADELYSVTHKLLEQAKGYFPELDLTASTSWLDIEWEIPNLVVSGRIDGIYHLGTRNLLVAWRPGKLRSVDRIQLWIKWLLLQVVEVNTSIDEACFVATDKVLVLTKLTKKDAEEQLSYIIGFWQKSLLQPIPFPPETAWSWVSSQSQEKTLSTYIGSNFPGAPRAEINDPHFYRTCPNLEEQFDVFIENAETIFGPLYQMETAAIEKEEN